MDPTPDDRPGEPESPWPARPSERISDYLPPRLREWTALNGQVTLSLRSLAVILGINLVVLLAAICLATRARPSAQNPSLTPVIAGQAAAASLPTPTPSLTPGATATDASPVETPESPALPVQAVQYPSTLGQGTFVLSFAEGTYAHLFAYQPQTLPLTHLTGSPWDDVAPAYSADGTRLAFSSRQNGYWDLFLLDLTSGETRRLTDTGDADRSPTWSPDGKWLAFETYTLGHAQIAVLSVDDSSAAPMFLTDDGNENHSPAWSPQGRRIAFVSTRPEGDSLWVADLGDNESRFTRVAALSDGRLSHPAWSPDGGRLAWGQDRAGNRMLMVWDAQVPASAPVAFANGDWPAWSPHGDLLATRIAAPNQDYLAVYAFPSGALSLPPQPLPARLLGLDWKESSYPQSAPQALRAVAAVQPTPLWLDMATPIALGPATRYGVAALEGVSAPQPSLSDQVDESFQALRRRLAEELGWDYLASLENAYVPITSPLPPGAGEDWLYTGRAFAVNPAPLPAGWMAVVREDFDGQTYWRIYLKARFQDGSQGGPLGQIPWDISARYGADPLVYEQGGAPAKAIPAGYWLDFTEFAARFGWQRAPAAPNWRTFYAGTRFNQLVRTDGLTWRAAMLELYPPEALPTLVPDFFPTTSAATATPPPLQPSLTPTRRPTWTPLPGG